MACQARGPRASIALRVLLPEEKRPRSAGMIVTEDVCQRSFAGSISEPSDFAVDGTSG